MKKAGTKIVDNTDYKIIEELNAEKIMLQNKIVELENMAGKELNDTSISNKENKKNDINLLPIRENKSIIRQNHQRIYRKIFCLYLIAVRIRISLFQLLHS